MNHSQFERDKRQFKRDKDHFSMRSPTSSQETASSVEILLHVDDCSCPVVLYSIVGNLFCCHPGTRGVVGANQASSTLWVIQHHAEMLASLLRVGEKKADSVTQLSKLLYF